MRIHVINTTGLLYLAAELNNRLTPPADGHPPLGVEHLQDRRTLYAWADVAEQMADSGETPIVELRAWCTRSGHTETITLDRDRHFDAEEIAL